MSSVVETVHVEGVEPDRSLATICRIRNIYPIAGADLIVLAEIQGWRCIVKKNEFNVGDLCIYFSIDAIPDLTDPNTEFMTKRGGRIRTIKMRGVISQGLIGPLSWLSDRGHSIDELSEGDDVTEQMGVTKYVALEEVAQYRGLVNDNERMPEYVPKTDENRLQTHLFFIEKIKDRNIVITEKEDGCSATFIFNDGKFSVCGRRFVWKEPDPSCAHYFHVAEKYDVEARIATLGMNVAIQGEVIGPKINGNRLDLTEFDFRVFNIFNIDKQEYLLHEEVTEICSRLGLNQVVEIYVGNANDIDLSLDNLLKMAGKQFYKKGFPAEGIVVKTNDRTASRVSFKVISNEYLLKYDL